MPEHVPDTWIGFGLHLMRTRPQGVPVEQIADDVTLFLMHVHDRQREGRGSQ